MITKSVYDAVLKELASSIKQTPTPPVISSERLMRYAKKMAIDGEYKFSEMSLKALESYLQGYGLFIYGKVGTGKTFFFNSLNKTITKPVLTFSMYDIFGKGETGIRQFIEDRNEYEMLIDDVGAEPTFNNYGVKFDALAYIIEMRMKSKYRTHFTTNLSIQEVATRYGARVIDRITEMCKSVEFTGPSLRRAKIYTS